jgi:hypothetical protein
MAALSTVASLSFIVQLATALAAGATGATAFKGYRTTGSSTFLRLFASFVLLSSGLALGAISSVLGDEVLSAIVLIAGSGLELAGYFLLALSHFFIVRRDIASAGILLLLPLVSVSVLMSLNLLVNALSLYLLLYVCAETIIFYFQNRSNPTLISIAGLLLIAVGVFLQMIAGPTEAISLAFEFLRLVGFIILFSPVAILFRRRPEVLPH